MKSETIPPGAVHPCPASIPGANRPAAWDLQRLREHVTALTPGKACSLSCPLCSAPPTIPGEHATGVRQILLSRNKPHTKILVKAVGNPCETSSSSRGGIHKD